MRKLLGAAAATLAALGLAGATSAGVPAGATIDDGARFTRTETVTLRLQPPPGATVAEIANDQDFTNPTRQEMGGQVAMAWTLLSTGPDGKRTVFVRYSGVDVDPSQVYSESIVLDRTRPVLRSAEAGPLPTRRGHGKVASTAASRCSFLLYVNARDKLSKVKAVEYAFGPKAKRRSRRAAPIIGVTAPRNKPRPARMFVRVRDGAGNRSKSRRVGLRSICR
jgi:hypothetical protein